MWNTAKLVSANQWAGIFKTYAKVKGVKAFTLPQDGRPGTQYQTR